MTVADILRITAHRLSFVSSSKTLNKKQYKILETVVQDLLNLSKSKELNNLTDLTEVDAYGD